MIDCHVHLWTRDASTPAARAQRADQLGREMDALGIDRLCLVPDPPGGMERYRTLVEEREVIPTAAMRTANEEALATVAEHPDRFYAWAIVDPRAEGAAEEFERAVEAGALGLKHHSKWFTQPLSHETLHPLAEVAVAHDVPILSHVTQRNPDRLAKRPWETQTGHVRELAESFPDLKLVSGHIGAGGDWEARLRNLRDLENVHLDVSGSNCEAGMVEAAADALGVDRLLFGTDTWLLPGVGKLAGADLPPEDRAAIAYNFHGLVGDHVPNRADDADVAARREAATERFAALDEPRPETVVDANAYLGSWPFQPLDATPEDLLRWMDRHGVDRAVVSSLDAVLYRNVQHGNRELKNAVAGHEDRLLPLATINPTYPGWRDDLECCLDWGFRGVRLFPLYHDYAVDDPAVVELMEACAERDVPVAFVATLEDQRKRHPRLTLRDGDDVFSTNWSDDHVDALIEVLLAAPGTDVVIANAWTAAERIVEACHEVCEDGVQLDNRVRSGRTLFPVNDLFVFFTEQARGIVENVGVEHLAFGPRFPFDVFQSGYDHVEHLPVDDDEEERVRANNALDLFA